jgi:hypothetical protein
MLRLGRGKSKGKAKAKCGGPSTASGASAPDFAQDDGILLMLFD